MVARPPATTGGAVIAVPTATVALVISAIIFAPFASYLAGRRARSAVVWFVLGGLIGPVAIALLLLAPPGRCPDCGTRVQGWPRRCASCGLALNGAVVRGATEPATALLSAEAPAPAARPVVAPPVSLATVAPFAITNPRADPTRIRAPAPTPLAPLGHAVDGTPDRSWEVVVSAPPAAPRADRPASRRRGRRRAESVGPSAHLLGSAIYLGGSASTATRVALLQVGDRYGLARDGDELQVLGPVNVDPERIVARVPLVGAEIELAADRLIVHGGTRSRRTALAFSGLAVSSGIDLPAILGAPADGTSR